MATDLFHLKIGAPRMARGTGKSRQGLDQRFPPTHSVRLTGKEILGAMANISTVFLQYSSTISRKGRQGLDQNFCPHTKCDLVKRKYQRQGQYMSSISAGF